MRDGEQREAGGEHRRAVAPARGAACGRRTRRGCSSQPSTPAVERAEHALRVRAHACGGSSSREHSTGTIVTATSSDIASENDTTAASWPNMMLETPVRNSIGTNTAMWVSVEARIADHTSSRAVDRRGHPVLAHLEVAVGVLEHDDRGVDDHADAERQAAEGQRVEGVAAEVEQREGADHRDRDRRADDQRRLQVAQEQVR